MFVYRVEMENFTHPGGLYSMRIVSVVVYTDSTKYTSRVSRRDDPPPPTDRTATALYIDSLLYYTFGVPSRNNDDDDDSNNNNNNRNNTKLLSSGAIDCGHGRRKPRIRYTDDATTCAPRGGGPPSL